MRSLSAGDASALLAFVRELHELEDTTLPFPPRVLGRLQELVASDQTCYSELDPESRTSILQVWHTAVDGDDGVDVGRGEQSDDETQLWWQLRNTHPLCGHRAGSGDRTSPSKVSDVATLRAFRRTPIYDAYYRGVVDHWLDVGLPATERRTRVFIFVRRPGRADFDERDRLVLELLQPHLVARLETFIVTRQAAAELAALEGGGLDDASRVVLCSSAGAIEFASASARALLTRHLGLDDGRLPEGVLSRRELVLEEGERTVHVRIARTGRGYVLLVEERDLRLETLTPREREVLDHAARGKQNDAIAFDLGITSATVSKHLERVYRKLGVPNRTSAVAVAATPDRVVAM